MAAWSKSVVHVRKSAPVVRAEIGLEWPTLGTTSTGRRTCAEAGGGDMITAMISAINNDGIRALLTRITGCRREVEAIGKE
jgi:hypothetical protein